VTGPANRTVEPLLSDLFGRAAEPIIPASAFAVAEAHWGVKLDGPIRRGLTEWFSTCERVAPQPEHIAKVQVMWLRDQSARAESVANAARELRCLLEAELRSDGPFATSLIARMAHSGNKHSVPAYIEALEAIEVDARTPLGAAPPREDRREMGKRIRRRTVVLLWFACERAGGKPTAYWNEGAGSLVTPFVEGAYILMRHLPPGVAARPKKRPGEIIAKETIGSRFPTSQSYSVAACVVRHVRGIFSWRS
jgi:hypothetical protein